MKKVAIRFHYPDEFFTSPADLNVLPFKEMKKSFNGKKRKDWDNYLDSSRATLNQLLLEKGYSRQYFGSDSSYYLFPDSDSLEKIAETIYLLLRSFNFRTELSMIIVEGSDSSLTRYPLMSIYKNPLQKVLDY